MAKKKNNNNILNDYLNNKPYVPDYLTTKKTNLENQIKTLDAQKYNADGSVKPTWNEQLEQNYILEKNKLNQDLSATESAFAQYMNNETLRNQEIAQQDIIRRQGQAYLNNELRAYGRNNVGSSESSRIGLVNAYGRNVANINRAVSAEQQGLLSNYMNTMRESDTLHNANKLSTTKEYQDVAYQDAYNAITSLMDNGNEKDVANMLTNVKNNVSKEQYDNLVNYYNLIKNSSAYKALNEAYNGVDTNTFNNKNNTSEEDTPRLRRKEKYWITDNAFESDEFGSISFESLYYNGIIPDYIYKKGEKTIKEYINDNFTEIIPQIRYWLAYN